MEATKTFTLTVPMRGNEDLLDMARILKNCANSLTDIWESSDLDHLPDSGTAKNSNDMAIATWEVR